jgi:membrane protein YqaA with SNARE-associated domain
VRDLLAVAGVGFLSALFPVVNIETLLAVRSAVAGVDEMWALALVAAIGQMAGKLIWYYLGANSLHWGWVRRKVEQPKSAARLELWRTRVHDRPVLTGLLTLVSAAVGVPPFAILSVLAGQLKMNLWLFVSLGLLGRWVRFLAVLSGGEWLGGMLGS